MDGISAILSAMRFPHTRSANGTIASISGAQEGHGFHLFPAIHFIPGTCPFEYKRNIINNSDGITSDAGLITIGPLMIGQTGNEYLNGVNTARLSAETVPFSLTSNNSDI